MLGLSTLAAAAEPAAEPEVIQAAFPVLYVQDDQVGVKLTPHTKIRFKTPYFDSTVVTNKEGFTGRSFAIEKRAYRIAILGDSAVESYSVSDDARFPAVMEQLIFDKTGGKQIVEVMGFGVSGWGPAHQYACLKHYVLKYSPDEVWIMFLPTNDFGDNTPLMNGPPTGPTFIYDDDDPEKIVDVAFGYPIPPAALLKQRRERYGAMLEGTRQRWTHGLLPYFWSDEKNPEWDLIESQGYQVLGLIKKLCDRQGIKMSVVYRVTGYDQSEANFRQFHAESEKFLGHSIEMQFGLSWKRFEARLAAMGIGFINTLKQQPKHTIATHKDAAEAAKHRDLADFLSDAFLARRKTQGQ
jgi:hypothetical protein